MRFGGALFAAPAGTAPHWRPCFTVESTDEAVARVRELGGRQLGESLDIGHGSIAMVLDPQGALFTMFAGRWTRDREQATLIAGRAGSGCARAWSGLGFP